MAIINIENHTPSKDDNYFFDCMILMYIFFPYGNYNGYQNNAYNILFGKARVAKSNIYVTDVLISEFINTFIRKQYNYLADKYNYPKDSKHFKEVFKKTDEYKELISEIKTVLERQIFPCVKRLDSEFSKYSFNHIFDEPETFDFNDRYYGLTVEGKSIYIVTNDEDFKNVPNCNIITANKKLIKATQKTTSSSTFNENDASPMLSKDITVF